MKYPALSELWRIERIKNQSIKTDGPASFGDHQESRVLAKFKQVFPLNLFPSSIIVEELRIVHLKRFGPWAGEVNSIMATDIACVYASTGILLGQIHIKSLTGGPEIYIDNLFTKDALAIRSMVEGIALASREGLKINHEANIEEEKRNFLDAGAIRYG